MARPSSSLNKHIHVYMSKYDLFWFEMNKTDGDCVASNSTQAIAQQDNLLTNIRKNWWPPKIYASNDPFIIFIRDTMYLFVENVNLATRHYIIIVQNQCLKIINFLKRIIRLKLFQTCNVISVEFGHFFFMKSSRVIITINMFPIKS